MNVKKIRELMGECCNKHFTYLCILETVEFIEQTTPGLPIHLIEEEEEMENTIGCVKQYYHNINEILDMQESCSICEPFNDLYLYIIDPLNKLYAFSNLPKEKKSYTEFCRLMRWFFRGIRSFEKQVGVCIEDLYPITGEDEIFICPDDIRMPL